METKPSEPPKGPESGQDFKIKGVPDPLPTIENILADLCKDVLKSVKKPF